MLDKATLAELKAKMPTNYAKEVMNAYYKRHNDTISRWTVANFFKGATYSSQLHLAVLDVVSMQQSLNIKTTEIINA